MPFKKNEVYLGDCLELLNQLPDESVDLIYLDPPFFTQKDHSLKTRDGQKNYIFSDRWVDISAYIDYLKVRIRLCKSKLKLTGSLFLHCDKSASHYLKVTLDEVFGFENFQSEIIWSYRRWSNAKKGLLSNHQNIFFYSKSPEFKFISAFEEYSPATNVDQIVQLRRRDNRSKTVYLKDANGCPVLATEKKGVPVGDVWDIPYLNPKAKERVSYPTQKPVLLIERIISLVTDPGDLVVDPFCGSGTTLVASQFLNRKFIGIDQNSEAVELAKKRLKNPVRTESKLLKKGRDSFRNLSSSVNEIVKEIGAISVQRNKGIDGLISTPEQVVPFKVVFESSQLEDFAKLISRSSIKNGYKNKALFARFNLEKAETQVFEKKYGVIVFNDLKKLAEKLKN
jgi:site-specific DNA-methyltransferase (adenine-specific)